MSVYKTFQRTEGLLQDMFWNSYVRSTPFSKSNFTTAALKNKRANKATFLNIVTEHEVIIFSTDFFTDITIKCIVPLKILLMKCLST